jgi:hypothetical protein
MLLLLTMHLLTCRSSQMNGLNGSQVVLLLYLLLMLLKLQLLLLLLLKL